MFDNYYDCENKCEFKYGQNKKCFDCRYYNDNEAELEMERELEIMEYNISRCETDYEGELFSHDI